MKTLAAVLIILVACLLGMFIGGVLEYTNREESRIIYQTVEDKVVAVLDCPESAQGYFLGYVYPDSNESNVVVYKGTLDNSPFFMGLGDGIGILPPNTLVRVYSLDGMKAFVTFDTSWGKEGWIWSYHIHQALSKLWEKRE
jgi:hypothetical protein